MVEKGAGFLATSTTDVYERQRMLAPLHLILCRHFQAFVLFDILCASYHIAGTRKLQLWELGMLEELNRQRGRDQTSHYTHPRAREDSQVLPFATQQHSSHQVYHHLEQMGLFAKPAENKYFFLAWGNFHINSLHIHMTCRHSVRERQEYVSGGREEKVGCIRLN